MTDPENCVDSYSEIRFSRLQKKTMFGHKYNWIFAGLLGIYSFLNILVLEGDRLFQIDISSESLFLVILAISNAVWFGNLLIQKKIVPKLDQFHPLLVQLLGSFVLASLISLISVEISGIVFGGSYQLSIPNLLLTGGFTFRINLFLNCVNAIVYFNKKFQQKELETERLKTLTISAQVETLNTQLNPHFFFNNLNALSVLIHENVHQADAYLQKMALIYRYLLTNRAKELVSLSEELEFLQSYLDLLKIRFGESIEVHITFEKDRPSYFIAPSVLQLLVENIIKHNYFTEKEPIAVQVKQQGSHIQVWNKKQKKEVKEHSHGIGLKNITERYAFLDQRITIQDEVDFFQVDIPLIEQHENHYH